MQTKPLYVIPDWCEMPPAEHHDGMGGCWGISHGMVAERGEPYCESCEFHKAKRKGNNTEAGGDLQVQADFAPGSVS